MHIRSECGIFVTLRVVTAESSVDQTAAFVNSNTTVVATDNVVHTRVNIRTTENHLTHLLTVTRSNTDWNSEFLCNLLRDTDFIDTEVRVR